MVTRHDDDPRHDVFCMVPSLVITAVTVSTKISLCIFAFPVPKPVTLTPGHPKPATLKPGGPKPATLTGAKDPNSKNPCVFN